MTRSRRSHIVTARQSRIPGIVRQPQSVKLHPFVRRDLIALARSQRVSVSMMVARLIIEFWHFEEPV